MPIQTMQNFSSGNTPSNVPIQALFELDPQQRLIHERIKRLIGPGPAASYFDACQHMAASHLFLTSTHLIGHLYRDLESALRDVLLKISTPPPMLEERQRKGKWRKAVQSLLEIIGLPDDQVQNLLRHLDRDTHKAQVELILKALGIPVTDEIATMWLGLVGERSPAKIAHRNSLDMPRPLNDEFRKWWQEVQAMLNAILDAFEKNFSKVFRAIDELAHTANPTKDDVVTLTSKIPNDAICHQRFFASVENPVWLPLLHRAGLFKNPPGLIRTEEGISYPMWHALDYAERMIPHNPILVQDILFAMPGIENPHVQGQLIQIAANLPDGFRAKLLPQMKTWVRASHPFIVTKKAESLIAALVNESRTDLALEVAEELLAILPDPASEKSTNEPFRGSSYNPKPRINDWEYGEMLKSLHATAMKDWKGVLKLLSKHLNSYYDLTYLHSKRDDFNELSYIGRPAIEVPKYHTEGADSSLITAILNIAREHIEKVPADLKDIIVELKQYPWRVFDRIAMYLSSLHPNIAPEITAEYLTKKEFFDSTSVKHEYALLLRSGFKILLPDKQKLILDWIAEGHAEAEKPEDLEAAKIAERRRGIWRRDKLSFIAEDLPEKLQQQYAELVQLYGEPDHADLPSRIRGGFVGPTSVVHAQEISAMSDEDLRKLLLTWEATEDRFFGPTKEGLARELGIAIKQNPERFVVLAEWFKGLDPTYVRAYFQTLEELIQKNISIDWKVILNLCQWVLDQTREIPNRKGEVMDRDPDWGWTRKAIASLIQRGLNGKFIPFELRDAVWRALEILADDPDPIPKDEEERSSSSDAYSLTINSVRGESLSAVVEYALWNYDNTGKEKQSLGFQIMPEVKELLEKHLDPAQDPSVAVRAVYGRYLPWLLLVDPEWTKTYIKAIFPKSQFKTSLYLAAWETYLIYVPVYNEPFNVLREQYLEAVENLGSAERESGRRNDRDELLAEQLMVCYLRELLKKEDELLVQFWEKASPELRGHALEFLGRSLLNEKDEPDARTAKALADLWNARLVEAEKTADKAGYQKEMAAFGWWFASGKFDPKWSSEQFLKALEISGEINSDHLIMQRMTEAVKTLPRESITILEKIIDKERRGWIILGSEGELRSILETALHAPEPEAQQCAKALINKLMARGYTQFEDLLKEENLRFD
jgi:hypothetical protein